jgi:hypothetical protein
MRQFLVKLQSSHSDEDLSKLVDPQELSAVLQSAAPLSFGNPAAADDTPQCALIWNSGGIGNCASGVLIAQGLLLTAAHVFPDLNPANAAALAIASGPITGPGPFSTTPCFLGSASDPWGVCLLQISPAAPLSLTPLAIATAPEFEALRTTGATVRLYGFGFGRAPAGAVLPQGVKRYVDLPILPDTSALASRVQNYDPNRMFVIGALGSMAPYVTACSGDSGGPAIATIGGIPKLVGIVQRAADGTGSSGGGDCGWSTTVALSRTDRLPACA